MTRKNHHTSKFSILTTASRGKWEYSPLSRIVKSCILHKLSTQCGCCQLVLLHFLYFSAGEKPHVCMVCGKGFSTSSSLNTHRRIHSGEKPHQCPVCLKRFTASSNLYYHRMTHIKVG